MKKIFSYAVLLIMSLLAVTSCSDDRDSNPVPSVPTTFVLNTPSVASQYIQLTEKGTIRMSWSQPDYGFPVNATYSIQVGLVQSDGTTIKWDTDSKTGLDSYLASTYTSCQPDINQSEVAEALCSIDAFPDKESYVDMGYRKIALRVRSALVDAGHVEVVGSGITSNPVYMDHVAAYNAVKSPGYLWVIGQCSGWTEPKADNAEKLKDWRITETGVGTKIYVGTLNIPAGGFQFRFYSALTGWDGGNSLGPDASGDDQQEISFAGNVYTGTLPESGKGGWQVTGWAGGNVKLEVDLNAHTVTFTKQ